MFSILSWNINGIRSVKQPLITLLNSLQADIICLQETKITRDMVEEKIAIVEGYNAYFSFPKRTSGYSGVVTYCKNSLTPYSAEESLLSELPVFYTSYDDCSGCWVEEELTSVELTNLDSEGRAVTTMHDIKMENGTCKKLAIINVYCPRADPDNPERLRFKLRFYCLLEKKAQSLCEAGMHVVIVGDINTTHKKIDSCNPSDEVLFNSSPSRIWLNRFLHEDSSQRAGTKFVDTFRYLYPEQTEAYTCWHTVTRARETNYGTRIDYVLADESLVREALSDSNILAHVQGSDHCPVQVSLRGEIIPAPRCPSMCTKYWPEFAGRQQNLLHFAVKGLKMNQVSVPEKNNTSNTNKKRRLQTNNGPSKKTSHSAGFTKQASIISFFSKGAKEDEKIVERNCELRLTGNNVNTVVSAAESTLNKKYCEIENDITTLSSSSCIDETSADELQFGTVSEIVFENNVISDNNSNIKHDSTVRHINSVNNISDVRKIKPEVFDKKPVPASSVWKEMLRGPDPPPLCKGHKDPCMLRTVKKPGPNFRRQFYACAKPDGPPSKPESNCNHFQWVNKVS